MKELIDLFETTLAVVVNGPFVNRVTLDPGTSDSITDCHISRARGCLSSGRSVSRGAPNFTEFSAVYLKQYCQDDKSKQVLLERSYKKALFIVSLSVRKA